MSTYDDWFNDFLDDLIEHRSAGPRTDDTLHADAAAAERFHEMVQRSDPYPGDGRMTTAMRRTWEEMTMPAQPRRFGAPIRPSGGRPVSDRRGEFRPFSWSLAASAVIAVLIVVGLIAVYREFNNRDGGDQSNLAMLSATGTPESAGGTATLPPIKAPSEVLTIPTLVARGTLEPETSAGADSMLPPYTPCTSSPISRENMLQRLKIDGPSQAKRDYSEAEPVDNDTEAQILITGDQFFSCLAEGKPLSAMNLMSDTYLQEWVFLQMMSMPGGPAKSSVDTLFDRFGQEQTASEAQSNHGRPDDAYDYFLGNFLQLNGAANSVRTSDGRVHVPFTFVSIYGYDNSPPEEITGMQPREIVFIYEGGEWRVDSLEHGNQAYFDAPF